jgi:hypothetical protein
VTPPVRSSPPQAESLQRERVLPGLRAVLRASALLMRERELRGLMACALLQSLASSFVMPYFSLFGTREVGMSVRVFGAFMTATIIANILIGMAVARRIGSRHAGPCCSRVRPQAPSATSATPSCAMPGVSF